jgi:hypothetical protein
MKTTRERWMKAWLLAGCVALCFAFTPARGDNIQALGGDWSSTHSWSPAQIPTEADNAFINYGRTQTLSTGTHAANVVRVKSDGGNEKDATFNMTGGSLDIDFDLSAGYAGSGGTGSATLSAGTLCVNGWLKVGSSDPDVAGEMTISGGTLFAANYDVGQLGLLTINGAGAVPMTGGHAHFRTNSTLRFNLGTDSVTRMQLGGTLNIYEGAQLIIDGSDFTGGEDDVIDLITFGGSKTGSFDPNNITFQNFTSGLTGEIGYDANSMTLTAVPDSFAELTLRQSGDWSDTNTWTGFALPAESESVLVNSDRTLTHSAGTQAVAGLRMSTQTGGSGRFHMTGGELSIRYGFATGVDGDGIGSTTMTGGTLTAGATVIGGKNAAVTDVVGRLDISGGTLNWGSTLWVGVTSPGALTVDGSGAALSGHDAVLAANSTLRFNPGAASVSALTASGALTIDPAAELIIDGSNFTGENGAVMDLFRFGSRTGTFDPENITIRNFSRGLTAEIEYDSDSIYLTVVAQFPPLVTDMDVSPEAGGDAVGVSFEPSVFSSLWFTPSLTEPAWTNVASGLSPLMHSSVYPEGFYKVVYDWKDEALEHHYTYPLVISLDNHSNPIGLGRTAEELAANFSGVDVGRLMVSAYGVTGQTTYPTTTILPPHPDLGDWDTLAVWKKVCRILGVQYWVYMNPSRGQIARDHPEWALIDSDGSLAQIAGDERPCLKAGTDEIPGFLEEAYLPMITEVVSRYKPGCLVIDHDTHQTGLCWCDRCTASWRSLHGNDPPLDSADPDWPAWKIFTRERTDEQRRLIAETVTEANPTTAIIRNHAWKANLGDPRTPPDSAFKLHSDWGAVGTFTGNRLAAMLASGEDRIPTQLVHGAFPRDTTRSLQRIKQRGSLAMASGAVWQGLIQPLDPESVARLHEMYDYVEERKPALGRTESRNPVAVLASETSRMQNLSLEDGSYRTATVTEFALAFQNNGWPVDVINEDQLLQKADRYDVIAVANQGILSDETVSALEAYVENGGTLLATGYAMRDNPEADPLLGIERTGGWEWGRRSINGELVWFEGVNLTVKDAEILWTFNTGAPAFLARQHGTGTAAYWAGQWPNTDEVLQPLIPILMSKVGIEPFMTCTAGRDALLVGVMRHRTGTDETVLHLLDLTSSVDGESVDPNSTNDIDPNPPLENLTVRLPSEGLPSRIDIYPETSVAASWADGELTLTIGRVDTHAAIVMEPH